MIINIFKNIIYISALLYSSAVLSESQRPLRDVLVYSSLSAPATVESLNNSTLSSEINAKVDEVHVLVGQRVKKGDLLVSLQCHDYRLQYEGAQADVASAEANYELAKSQLLRSESLLAKELLSQQLWDANVADEKARAAAYRRAKVAQQQASLQLTRCEITAPYDGVISHRLISVGQLATIGSPLVAIVDTKRVEVSAQIAQRDVPYLLDVSQFEFNAEKYWPVTIQNISEVIDSKNRSQEVRFVFSGDMTAPVGAAGKVRWFDPRPMIPAKYIVERDGQLGVFINEDGIAVFALLENAAPGRAALTSLPLDAMLITDGLAHIQAGAKL